MSAVMGRPTDYTENMLRLARRYHVEYKDAGDEIPSVVGLAAYIGRARTTIHRWANEEGKEEFRDILDEINETQAQVLVNNGLNGKFNSNITKLVLGKHGYHDKQEHTGRDGGPIETTELSPLELARQIAFALAAGEKELIEGEVIEYKEEKI